MFTVLPNTRLFLIGALVIVVIILLTLAVATAMSAALASDIPSNFSLGHLEWASNLQNGAIPATGNSDASEYFQPPCEQAAAGVATPLVVSPQTAPGMACESPVDCR